MTRTPFLGGHVCTSQGRRRTRTLRCAAPGTSAPRPAACSSQTSRLSGNDCASLRMVVPSVLCVFPFRRFTVLASPWLFLYPAFGFAILATAQFRKFDCIFAGHAKVRVRPQGLFARPQIGLVLGRDDDAALPLLRRHRRHGCGRRGCFTTRRSADALEGVLEPARRGPPPAPATY